MDRNPKNLRQTMKLITYGKFYEERLEIFRLDADTNKMMHGTTTEQSYPVGGVPAHGGGVELDGF